VSNWIIWQFQGLYKTVDNQLVVIRSHSYRGKEHKNYFYEMLEESSGYSLFATNATIEAGRVVERNTTGYFSFTVR